MLLVALARETHVDLLVLAANPRQFTGRPFLGHGGVPARGGPLPLWWW
jgi:hypothetical protein